MSANQPKLRRLSRSLPLLAMPLLLGLAASLLPSFADRTRAAHPEPAIVNPSWELDFSAKTPDAIAITNADGETRWYWYLPYKVVNNTGKSRLFIPEITIADDQGRIVPAGQDVPARAFDKIKKRLDNPLLDSPIDVVGKLLVGEDYARESVAIWPASKQDVDSFRIFISGLSGETATVENPRTGKPVLMRRTRMLRFETPGNYDTPQYQPVKQVEQAWVMR